MQDRLETILFLGGGECRDLLIVGQGPESREKDLPSFFYPCSVVPDLAANQASMRASPDKYYNILFLSGGAELKIQWFNWGNKKRLSHSFSWLAARHAADGIMVLHAVPKDMEGQRQGLLFRVNFLIKKLFYSFFTHGSVLLGGVRDMARVHNLELQAGYSACVDGGGDRCLKALDVTAVKRIPLDQEFYLIFSKQGSSTPACSLLEALIHDLGRKLEIGIDSLELEKIIVTGKGKAVVFVRLPAFAIVVRVPLSLSAKRAEQFQFEFTGGLHEKVPSLKALIPRQLSSGRIGAIEWFAETRVNGRALLEVIRGRDRIAVLPSIEGCLKALCQQRLSSFPVLDGDRFEILVSGKVKDLCAVVAEPILTESARSLFANLLRGEELMLSLVHGDFSVRNIYVEGGNISGLIDWEDAEEAGFSILDTYNYLDSVHRACNPGQSVVDSLQLFLDRQWPVPEEYRFLESMLEYHRIHKRHVQIIACLYAVTHLSDQLRLVENESVDAALVGRCKNVLELIATLSADKVSESLNNK